jgi:hypothetical protein
LTVPLLGIKDVVVPLKKAPPALIVPAPVNVIPEPVPLVVFAIVISPVELIVPVERVTSVRLLPLLPLPELGLIAMEPADKVPAPTAKVVMWFPDVVVVPFMVTAPVTVNEFVVLNVRLFSVAPALKVRDAMELAGDTFRIIACPCAITTVSPAKVWPG